MRFVFVILFLLKPLAVKAEYRVYQLNITDATSGSSRTVTTTLDPLQYSGYYPVLASESTQLQATWMCWGRTDGYTAYCDNPRPASPPPNTP